MAFLQLIFASLWLQVTANDYIYNPYNISRATLSGVAAYRSALTLDWLAAEDSRQSELAAAFGTEAAPTPKFYSSDCIQYAQPASGKVARLMLELLKNLEGDDGAIIPELIQALMRSKLLVETAMLDAEPDLEALVRTPDVMKGEPHTSFPRILAMVWMSATDPIATKRHGWCPIHKVNKYLSVSKPALIAKQLHALEPIIARARFIMDEFIQHVTPIDVYNHKNIGYGNKEPRSSVKRTKSPPQSPTRTTTDMINDAYDNLPTAPAAAQMLQPSPTVINERELKGVSEEVPKNGSQPIEICYVLIVIVLVL